MGDSEGTKETGRQWLQCRNGGESKAKATVGVGRGLSQGESEGARLQHGIEQGTVAWMLRAKE